MKIKSILSALLLMACTMTSAQKYLNVKLEDGTYRSFVATPKMEISFDKTAKEEKESGNTIVVNGYEVTIQMADDITPHDVMTEVYADWNAVKIDAISKTGKILVCTINGEAEVSQNESGNFYTFTVSDISENTTVTIGYTTGTEKRTSYIDVNLVQLWENGPKFAEHKMTSAQKYLNVKLEGGSYRSFVATPKMEISFDKTAKEEKESGNTIVVNGYEVAIQMADDITPHDVMTEVYADWNAVKIEAISKTGKILVYTINGEAEVTRSESGGFYTFTVSGISENTTVTIGYPTTGTEKRTGDIEVNWVQLWDNGPKFAEYNVGATEIGSYDGYYKWSSSCVSDQWGRNWRLPTKGEFQALIDNCTNTWTDNYNGTGVKGKIFTGKGDYKDNKVFFPAAADADYGTSFQGYYGDYWSSTPIDNCHYTLLFDESGQSVSWAQTSHRCSVRAVLAE